MIQLCHDVPVHLEQLSQSSAFSPTLFVGEKVAKPDEGVSPVAARVHESREPNWSFN
jgi:hypothetical protein